MLILEREAPFESAIPPSMDYRDMMRNPAISGMTSRGNARSEHDAAFTVAFSKWYEQVD